MTCLHNHDQILEFLRKIYLKGFQIYQNYLCALSEENHAEYDMFMKNEHWGMHLNDYNIGERWNEFQSQAISDWPKIMKTE